jgi:antitoxin ParD1/3/4
MPTSVALTPRFEKLTQQLISSGKYNNVSEVVREGLRMVEEREKLQKLKLKRLKDAIQVGQDAMDRGDYVTVRNSQELRSLLSTLSQQSSQKLASEQGRKAA